MSRSLSLPSGTGSPPSTTSSGPRIRYSTSGFYRFPSQKGRPAGGTVYPGVAAVLPPPHDSRGMASTARGGDKMTKLLTALGVAALALAVLAAASGPAGATYRGKANGRLAFGINVNGNTDVYSVLPNGDDLQRLTTDPGFDACAAYSADGKRIAYCSGASGGPVQVWTMNQDGTDKQQVTHLGFVAIFPDFSRDGRKIVFCAGPTALGRDIYVVNSDGTGLEQLTSGEGNNVYPAFSPHGHKIVFTSNRTGTSQVWVMK